RRLVRPADRSGWRTAGAARPSGARASAAARAPTVAARDGRVAAVHEGADNAERHDSFRGADRARACREPAARGRRPATVRRAGPTAPAPGGTPPEATRSLTRA